MAENSWKTRQGHARRVQPKKGKPQRWTWGKCLRPEECRLLLTSLPLLLPTTWLPLCLSHWVRPAVKTFFSRTTRMKLPHLLLPMQEGTCIWQLISLFLLQVFYSHFDIFFIWIFILHKSKNIVTFPLLSIPL